MFRSPRHRSVWQQTVPLVQRFGKLHGSHRSNSALIGGGITGLSTALELLERGYSVAIYEAGMVRQWNNHRQYRPPGRLPRDGNNVADQGVGH